MKYFFRATVLALVCLTGCSSDESSKCLKRFDKLGQNGEMDAILRDSLKLQLKEMKKAGYSEAAIKEFCNAMLGKEK